jgi:hypothetical protein
MSRLASELAGAFGDFGTIVPLVLAAAVVCRLPLAPILLFFGIWYILTGLVYRLPIPVEPMKAVPSFSNFFGKHKEEKSHNTPNMKYEITSPARTTHKISAPRTRAAKVPAPRMIEGTSHEIPMPNLIVTLTSRPTNEKRMPWKIRW